MGGRALNKYGVQTERKNTLEFNQIGYELGIKVFHDKTLFSSVIKCYHTKFDHGDLDLLINVPIGIDINWVNYIKSAFEPQAVYANGGVYSFDYKNFQVDFIPIPESKWNSALIYFSYDPLGNIMGKTYHKFGLSYGWQGLFYKFRNFNGINSQDILLTTNSKKIFDFGGYDFERYQKGFETLEDIFNFCIAGKYFDAEMFQMENLKSIDRKRNKKRGSYHLFLNYLKDNNINKIYQFKENKEEYFQDIVNYFPDVNFMQQLEVLKEQDKIKKIISQKFNGDIIMTWLPNLQGKELGAAMAKFKESLGNEYDKFILNESYEMIKKLFMFVYNGNQE
jgi:hypothetical protein